MGMEQDSSLTTTLVQNGLDNVNSTILSPTKRRSFASKLETLRTYKEIPKDELIKGDAIKQLIKPRGLKPFSEVFFF